MGRTELIASVEAHTAAGHRVVLTGPSGIGKSAVIEALAAAARARGERVLHLAGAESERWIPCTALSDLLRQIPHELVGELRGPLRTAVDATLLRARSTTLRDPEPRACRFAWQALLERCADDGPALLLVDDAQWIDTLSADVIAYATRRVTGPGRRLRVVAAGHPGQWALPAALEIPVPALTPGALTELLRQYALPARIANKLHADSAGNPYLALALGGAFADRSPGDLRPVPLPHPVHLFIAERLHALPDEVRQTLLTAALADRPTADLLRRAGRDLAENEIAAAASAGLLVSEDGAIRFTPPVVASVITQSAPDAQRARTHRALATIVTDAAGRIRHRALATATSDADLSRSLATAAETACRNGARALAAELYLLAADRTPAESDAERLEWLVTAAEVAAAGSLPETVHRAADAVLAAGAHPAQRVRVRLALIDLSGQGVAGMDEVLAGALVDAEGDAALTARVRLRLSWAEIMNGQLERGRGEAQAAAKLARSAQDPATEAMALTMQALAARVTARPAEARAALAAAQALPQSAPPGMLHMSPHFHAARFAFFDDRLHEARLDLLKMLARVERGLGDELVVVLRCLSEVSARMGRCRDALDFASRAMRVSRECGTSPGPAWYSRAVAELAGGTLARAAFFAERAVHASEQEHDAIYVGRGLHALGQTLLRSGDVPRAVQVLQRVAAEERARGLSAPVVLRWHGDLALGLVRLGRSGEARIVMAEAREALAREVPDAADSAVTAQLDRAEAVLLAGCGDMDRALALLDGAEQSLASLGQPLEQGHCLLVRSRIERRRRRFSAARQAATSASELFGGCGARPWSEQAARALALCEGTGAGREIGAGRRLFPALTSAEERIAVLVGDGATNREVAARMFLSAKTVEGVLTRVYRKVGVRSRTQLGSLIRSARGAGRVGGSEPGGSGPGEPGPRGM
ncbi:helix-turn-helix transcriptional regulator [Streptomyces laurentii]|uniref:helix-turn-helix transcriptional regulator n=1 Tax=Streptomyces laurentii TaxID=39478 RepID=UPI0033E29DE8